MNFELYIIILIAVLIVLNLVAPAAVRTYLRYRGKRVITCPETRTPAAVNVDTRHAVLKAVFAYPELRLKSCSGWPERQGCGQACLLQIKLSPEDCLVKNILTDWYDGKYCVSCATKFGKIQWLDHKPALLTPLGNTVEWDEVIPEEVPEVLATHFPVCWNCHITQTFFHKYPEKIVDRSRISAGVHREIIG